MCEAHAFLLREGKEQKILENVDRVEMNESGVRLVSIFGEQQFLKARLKEYNNREQKLLFEPL